MITVPPTKINLGHTEVLMRADGIVQVNATDRCYTKEDILLIDKCIGELTGTKKAGLLLLASDYTSIDTDARQFLASPQAGKYSFAKAYVIKSMAQRMLLNFLIKVNGTPVPSKFFTETTTALEWIESVKIGMAE